jgi:ribonucleoside-diphosphate reductase alpha chain
MNLAQVSDLNIIDFKRDAFLDDFTIATLRDRYLLPHEKSPQEAFYRAASSFSDSPEMAARLYGYASRLWMMFSTPILSNAGSERGMPISCFLNFVPDSREGITDHYKENAFLSSFGGGIGGYWGSIRSDGIRTSRGSRSSGSIPFIRVVDPEMIAFSQGDTRRGSYAAYQDIWHPEIEEFIDIRKETGGDPNRKTPNLHQGVNISDKFMQIIEQKMLDVDFDDSWDLIDPHTKKVVNTVSACALWEKIIETRSQTGEPYLHFVDASNRALPQAQKDLGLKINASNLCSEIVLATDENRSAICCLSSVNLEYYDEWKNDKMFIKDMIRMLDNVIDFFIKNAPSEMHRAVYAAKMERSLGLGAMGFHSYLQKKMIPIESLYASSINKQIFKYIKSEASKASLSLAKERGECPDGIGYGIRNMHLLAIAPNASSAIICGGTSPSIEPIRANVFTHKTLSGSFMVKNKQLAVILEKHKKNDAETWMSITKKKGSVQHLAFLSELEKDVFKTSSEIDQRILVSLAGERQPSICQSQSLNLFFDANASIAYIHQTHFDAWKKGCKSLYYYRTEAKHRAVIDDSYEIEEQEVKFKDFKVTVEDECFYCQG